MLERPEIPDSRIIARLRDEFGLNPGEIHFLPIGAGGQDRATGLSQFQTEGVIEMVYRT